MLCGGFFCLFEMSVYSVGDLFCVFVVKLNVA